MMTNFERIDLLHEAGDKISEAIALIEEAVEGTSEEASAKAYIIGHLNTWIGNGNPYDRDVYKMAEDFVSGKEGDIQ